MYARVQKFFNQQAGHVSKDQVANFVAAYNFPLPLQLKDSVMVFPTPDSLSRWLGNLFVWLEPRSGETLSFHVAALDIPRRGRFRTWVTIQRWSASGTLLGASTGIYFMRDLGDRLAIEMVHCELGQEEIKAREHEALRKVG